MTAPVIAAAAGLWARVWELAGRRLGPREAGSVTVWVEITTAANLADAALDPDTPAPNPPPQPPPGRPPGPPPTRPERTSGPAWPRRSAPRRR